MTPKKETFCIVPFTMLYSMNNGDYRACCHSEPGFPIDSDPNIPANFFNDSFEEVWNNNYYRQLRLDLINGVRNKTCATCWKLESNNEYSFRNKYNLNEKREEVIQFYTTETLRNKGKISWTPKSIQIKMGNLCNLKCMMCNQASSNLIEKEINEWKEKNIVVPKWLSWVDKHEIDWTGIDENTNFEILYKNLRSGLIKVEQIQLVGGEPLVNPITPLLLERLIEERVAENIRIYFISNLTSLTDKMVNLLSQFKESVISVSWDHVDPEKFKYIRFPANYHHFEKNVDKLLDIKNIDPKISTTFNIFNIFDVPEIFDKFESISQSRGKEYTVNFQYVENPNYLSVRYLDEDQKSILISSINKYLAHTKDYKIWKENPATYNQLLSIENMLSKPLNDFEETVKERTRILKLYDQTRHTDYKSLFPFIRDYD